METPKTKTEEVLERMIDLQVNYNLFLKELYKWKDEDLLYNVWSFLQYDIENREHDVEDTISFIWREMLQNSKPNDNINNVIRSLDLINELININTSTLVYKRHNGLLDDRGESAFNILSEIKSLINNICKKIYESY